jgi:hypothetical protein
MPPAPPAFYPGWVLTDMFFATEARAELERRAGGPVVQNLNRNYNLTPGEQAYLMGLGVPIPQQNAWLNTMNSQRNVSAPPYSRNYLERNASYNGKIKNPVLTVHTLIDPLVTVSQQNRYAQIVNSAGRGRFLYQVFTNGNGHCNFSGDQLGASLSAIESWVATGTPPTAANFPSAIGFLPGFVPPAMNQP